MVGFCLCVCLFVCLFVRVDVVFVFGSLLHGEETAKKTEQGEIEGERQTDMNAREIKKKNKGHIDIHKAENEMVNGIE